MPIHILVGSAGSELLEEAVFPFLPPNRACDFHRTRLSCSSLQVSHSDQSPMALRVDSAVCIRIPFYVSASRNLPPRPPVGGFPALCGRSLRWRVLDGSATICISALRPIPNSGHGNRVQLCLDFPVVSSVWLFANDSHLWRVLQACAYPCCLDESGIEYIS